MINDTDVLNNLIKILKNHLEYEEDKLYSSFILHLIDTLKSSKNKIKRSVDHKTKKRKIGNSKTNFESKFSNNTYGILLD